MAEVSIDHLGRRGDGIAKLDNQDIFVPFSLPGETVEVTGNGPRRSIISIINGSNERIAPICKHFESCGGCQTQHMSEKAYLDWKGGLVSDALSKVGIDTPIEAVKTYPDGSRRKAVFSAKQTSKQLLFGFQERLDNQVIDITECPVTVPEITDRIDDIRDLVRSVPGAKTPLRISVLAARNGLDISVENARELKGPERQTLIRKTVNHGFSRLAVNDEILIEVQRPEMEMGSSIVSPPPGSFVQAIEAAELDMADLVAGHLKSCKNVIDLYCGVGTFALRLAEKSKVTAAEASSDAIKALDRAWRETAGKLKQIKSEVRNLERRPYGFQELKYFDGLVFDPPRAGAELQAKQIARSKVKRVAAVSCNPTSLARDLEILQAGGYKILRIIPVDQFRYTPHIELVALLER